jgi:ATP-dependent DNA ligase
MVLRACEGDQGPKLFEHAKALDLEGILSKRLDDSRYKSGPSRDWLKIKFSDYRWR